MTEKNVEVKDNSAANSAVPPSSESAPDKHYGYLIVVLGFVSAILCETLQQSNWKLGRFKC